MSQQTTTTTTESGESSKLAGHSSDTSNLASLSREVELRVAVQDSGTETNDIKQLVQEFRGLYEQRLRCLELDTTVTQEVQLQVSRCLPRCHYFFVARGVAWPSGLRR